VADRDATGAKRDRAALEALVAGKHRVTDQLVDAYGSDEAKAGGEGGNAEGGAGPEQKRLTRDDVRRVIESLADAVAYVESNVRPVQSMIRFLRENFDPQSPRRGYSLSLSAGGGGGQGRPAYRPYGGGGGFYGTSAYSSGSNEGPTLSHNHPTQYMFVWQSLNLWAKVMRSMHRLWVCADDDLLSTTSTYHLYNTGQGLNRVQHCPSVRSVMSRLLGQTQKEAGAPWVGLSVVRSSFSSPRGGPRRGARKVFSCSSLVRVVFRCFSPLFLSCPPKVHLGDRDVPNALVFIDKYTQIPRFLTPIVQFIHGLPDLCSDPVIREYVDAEFGSADDLALAVLADYFKHGFDGSGDDGGSCIDGRLTSSWNWTSRIAKKRYYHAFMMSGFQGFDGDFR
jgi:hypothetical protein